MQLILSSLEPCHNQAAKASAKDPEGAKVEILRQGTPVRSTPSGRWYRKISFFRPFSWGWGWGKVAELPLDGGPVSVVRLQPVLGRLIHCFPSDQHLQPVQPAWL